MPEIDHSQYDYPVKTDSKSVFVVKQLDSPGEDFETNGTICHEVYRPSPNEHPEAESLPKRGTNFRFGDKVFVYDNPDGSDTVIVASSEDDNIEDEIWRCHGLHRYAVTQPYDPAYPVRLSDDSVDLDDEIEEAVESAKILEATVAELADQENHETEDDYTEMTYEEDLSDDNDEKQSLPDATPKAAKISSKIIDKLNDNSLQIPTLKEAMEAHPELLGIADEYKIVHPLIDDDVRSICRQIAKDKGVQRTTIDFDNQRKLLSGEEQLRACVALKIQPRFKQAPKVLKRLSYVLSQTEDRYGHNATHRAYVGYQLLKILRAAVHRASVLHRDEEIVDNATDEIVQHSYFLKVSDIEKIKLTANKSLTQIAAKYANSNARNVKFVETLYDSHTNYADLIFDERLPPSRLIRWIDEQSPMIANYSELVPPSSNKVAKIKPEQDIPSKLAFKIAAARQAAAAQAAAKQAAMKKAAAEKEPKKATDRDEVSIELQQLQDEHNFRGKYPIALLSEKGRDLVIAWESCNLPQKQSDIDITYDVISSRSGLDKDTIHTVLTEMNYLAQQASFIISESDKYADAYSALTKEQAAVLGLQPPILPPTEKTKSR